MDLYTDLQPSLRCRPNPSHLRMDMLSDCWYQRSLCGFHHLCLLSLFLQVTNRSLKSPFSLISHLELQQFFSLTCSEDFL